MRCFLLGLVATVVLIGTPAASARAEESTTVEAAPQQPIYHQPRRLTYGFSIDLFPIIASAVQREFGFSGQLHVAVDHVQFRLVGAKLRVPAFTLPEDFQEHDQVVLAFLLDYFFKEDASGFWISSGFEVWLNQVGSSNTAEKADWINAVWTLGGGYVWRFCKHFFINPWIGMHVRMNNPVVELGGETWRPAWVVANASMKIGVYFDL